MSEQKFPPLAIDTIARIFASKDAESPLYFKGPQLVNLFNGLGFPDHYSFVDGKGIRTLDYGDGLSRYTYALRRLEKLNESFKVPSAIQAFVNASQQPMEAIRAFQDKLKAWGIQVYAKDGQVSESQDKEEALPYLPDVLIDNKRTTPQDQPEGTETNKDKTDEQSALETEILGEIPPDRPVVFISYSWDSDSHKEWVAKLAEDIAHNGIHVLLDQYVGDGTMLPVFMELGIERADRVIIIGTEEYKKKALDPNRGVAFEGCIIRTALFQNIGTRKFITCLKKGSFKTSFPLLVSSLKGHDFRKEDAYENELDSLCRDIWKKPLKARPPLGPIPDYVHEE